MWKILIYRYWIYEISKRCLKIKKFNINVHGKKRTLQKKYIAKKVHCKKSTLQINGCVKNPVKSSIFG